MADVMGRCSQLPRASRFPLSMVDVISSRSKLLLASRFLPNIMVDVLNLRFPVNMVDVRFPLNMVDGMGSLGRILLAHRFQVDVLSSRSKLPQESVQLLLGTPAPCKLILQTWASLRRLSPSFLRAMAKW